MSKITLEADLHSSNTQKFDFPADIRLITGRRWVPSLDWLKFTAQMEGGLEVYLHHDNEYYSIKHVNYCEVDGWNVYNLIDETELQGLSDEELSKQTFIIDRLNKKALSYDRKDLFLSIDPEKRENNDY